MSTIATITMTISSGQQHGPYPGRGAIRAPPGQDDDVGDDMAMEATTASSLSLSSLSFFIIDVDVIIVIVVVVHVVSFESAPF